MRRACLWTFSLLENIQTNSQVSQAAVKTLSMRRQDEAWSSPGVGSEEEAVKDDGAEIFWSKLVREQSEVSGQQVQEDVSKGHVVVGLHCEGPAQTQLLLWLIFKGFISQIFSFRNYQHIETHPEQEAASVGRSCSSAWQCGGRSRDPSHRPPCSPAGTWGHKHHHVTFCSGSSDTLGTKPSPPPGGLEWVSWNKNENQKILNFLWSRAET